MAPTSNVEPIDYLVVGHVAVDITPHGAALGGTAAFASLTADALGARVGLVTSCRPDLNLTALDSISIHRLPSEENTVFENRYVQGRRRQWLRSRALPLKLNDVPDIWRKAPILHLAPIDDELDPMTLGSTGGAFTGVTPQGWWRRFGRDGRVAPLEPEAALARLPRADACVFSDEDLQVGETWLASTDDRLGTAAMTKGRYGADVRWQGETRHFDAPISKELDPTGAGDIFAAVFFFIYSRMSDAWAAARWATELAAESVSREGLAGVPSPERASAILREATA